jgi:competence protein ComEC
MISVPANLIFIPLIGCVVLPLGLVSVLVFSSWPSLAVFLIHGCEHLIVFSIFISRFMVSLPGSWFRLFTLGYGQIAGLYLICLAAFFMLKKPGKIFASVLVVTVSSLALNFSYHGRQDRAKEELVMTVLDVGQGSSTLIQTAEGKCILVDGGGFSDSASFDTGRLIVAPVLWKNRITVLDYVILSHPEADHLNGLIFILENFKVHTFIQNTDEKITDRYETLVRICNKKGIPIWKPSAQGRKLFLGQTEIVFLRASPLVFFDDFNNNSLVFKLIYNQFTMLFPGDILAAREERLGRCDQVDLVSDILLSPHHGSRTSSSKFFLDKVQPKSVIVSCGRNNRYNFPHDEVLRRYGKMGITVYRTDADGAIFISSDGRNFSIKTYKGG